MHVDEVARGQRFVELDHVGERASGQVEDQQLLPPLGHVEQDATLPVRARIERADTDGGILVHCEVAVFIAGAEEPCELTIVAVAVHRDHAVAVRRGEVVAGTSVVARLMVVLLTPPLWVSAATVDLSRASVETAT